MSSLVSPSPSKAYQLIFYQHMRPDLHPTAEVGVVVVRQAGGLVIPPLPLIVGVVIRAVDVLLCTFMPSTSRQVYGVPFSEPSPISLSVATVCLFEVVLGDCELDPIYSCGRSELYTS